MSDETYPGAKRIANKYSGDTMSVNTVVWHSTEGTSLSDYAGGSEAPTLTAVPNFTAKRLDWYQHFDFNVSSRALVNLSGGVQTNTLNVAQVELVGTCDPATHKKWTEAGIQHLYMPQLPYWVVRDLHAFCLWTAAKHDVPMAYKVFKAYPGSYGVNNGVRMTNSEWLAFKGHCGHQHVPENLHGDPGSFPMFDILHYKVAPPVTSTDVVPVVVAQTSITDIANAIGKVRYPDATLGHTRLASDFPGAIMEKLDLIAAQLKDLASKLETK